MSFLNRLFGSLRTNSLGQSIMEEQQYHIELAARELEAQGLDADEARRQARLRFGNETRAQEETRRQDLLPWVDDFARDLRIAFRGLRRSPSYSLVVLLALALGIGANTAIYTVVHSVLFRAFPYPDSERLTFIFTRLASGGRTWANYDDIQDWARDSKAFSSIAAWTTQTVNLTGGGEPDRLRGGFVSNNFFTTLGVAPALGRNFLPLRMSPAPLVSPSRVGACGGRNSAESRIFSTAIFCLTGSPIRSSASSRQSSIFPLIGTKSGCPLPRGRLTGPDGRT